MKLYDQILFLEHVQYELIKGRSFLSGLRSFRAEERPEFLQNVLNSVERGRNGDSYSAEVHQLSFLIEQGLAGNSVTDQLEETKQELLNKKREKIQRELKMLPVLFMIPLLLFLFPAYLILLVGPVILDIQYWLQ